MKDVLKQSMGNIFGKRTKFSDLHMVLFYGLLLMVVVTVYIVSWS